MKYNDEDTIIENGQYNSNDEQTVIDNGPASKNDEGTIVDDQEKKDSQEEEKTGESSTDKNDDQPSESKKGVNWKQVAVTTSSAAVMGAAGVLLTSFVTSNVDILEDGKPEDSKTESNNNTTNTSKPETQQTTDTEAEQNPSENVAEVRVEGLPVSHNVTEDMSFDEAFTAARQEVGPGGVFEWHGGVYGTYYASEWNAMSETEQQEFGSHISYRESNTEEPSSTSETKDEIAEVEIEHEAEIIEEGVVDIPEAEIEDASSVEVELLGQEVVTLEDGTQMGMGYMQVEGHNAVVVDVDIDGTYDVLAVDINDNNEMDADEVADIHGAGFTTEDYSNQMNPDPDLYAELPDYTNDADPSSFS